MARRKDQILVYYFQPNSLRRLHHSPISWYRSQYAFRLWTFPCNNCLACLSTSRSHSFCQAWNRPRKWLLMHLTSFLFHMLSQVRIRLHKLFHSTFQIDHVHVRDLITINPCMMFRLWRPWCRSHVWSLQANNHHMSLSSPNNHTPSSRAKVPRRIRLIRQWHGWVISSRSSRHLESTVLSPCLYIWGPSISLS